MTHITQAMLEDAINAQGDEFDTHDIVRFLYTKQQHEYLRELTANAAAKYPFTETHRQLGQCLTKLPHLIQKVAKPQSDKTMRGELTKIQKWRKI